MNCVLCGIGNCIGVSVPNGRSLYRCLSCGLVFVCPENRVSLESERARYALHTNDADAAGYVRYMSGIANQLSTVLFAGARILDFGSGENYVLTRILRERGYACDAYDPLYALDLHCGAETYDGIVLCESIEHIRNLPENLRLLKKLSNARTVYFVKTQLYDTATDFATWWYAQDCTHINFFNEHSMHSIAQKLQRTVSYCDNRNTVIFTP